MPFSLTQAFTNFSYSLNVNSPLPSLSKRLKLAFTSDTVGGSEIPGARLLIWLHGRQFQSKEKAQASVSVFQGLDYASLSTFPLPIPGESLVLQFFSHRPHIQVQVC
mmetsp:Transcript_12474/g.38051  ORF Transcript_12474/g.38051 Transcript_12474/m.38051 type:complete len:107 (-) Transcript_12474:226-546(-)